jgi:hypothetical protein
VDKVTARNKPLILAVAAYADRGHHGFEMLRTVARISRKQPGEAFDIWMKMLEASRPDYPEDAIKEALQNLVKAGPDGVRQAKQIADQYLRSGNDKISAVVSQLS